MAAQPGLSLQLFLQLHCPDTVDGVVHLLPGADALVGLGPVPHHLGMVANETLYLPARVEVQYKAGVLRLPLPED